MYKKVLFLIETYVRFEISFSDHKFAIKGEIDVFFLPGEFLFPVKITL